MFSCSCSRSSSSSVWRCFGVLTGSIFSLPPHEEGPSAPGSTVCSSPAAQTIAPPVVSPPLPRRVEGQHQRMSRPWHEVKSRCGAPKRIHTECIIFRHQDRSASPTSCPSKQTDIYFVYFMKITFIFIFYKYSFITSISLIKLN
jgi:hypothetical protein